MAKARNSPNAKRLPIAIAVAVSVPLLLGVVAASAAPASPRVVCNNLDAASCETAWRDIAARATENEPALAELELMKVDVRNTLCGIEGYIEWSDGRAALFESFC